MSVSAQARKADPNLPAFWEARAIETTNRHGKKPILLTSLLDAKAYRAREIVHQYEERWRIETSYREIKQDMLGSELTLRSATPKPSIKRSGALYWPIIWSGWKWLRLLTRRR